MDEFLLKCRICLEDDNGIEEMFDLFGDEMHSSIKNGKKKACGANKLHLLEKIELCCGIKLEPHDNLPKRMCGQCLDELSKSFNFRQLCIESQLELKSLKSLPSESDAVNIIEYKDEEKCNNPDVISIKGIEEDPTSITSELYLECLESDSESNEGDDVVEKENSNCDTIIVETITEDMISLCSDDNLGDSVATKYANKIQQNETNIRANPKKKEPRTYQCNFCGNTFQIKKYFTNHMKYHTNAKQHKCEICSKSFQLETQLRVHMLRHAGKRSFKCNYCDRSFFDSSGKTRHERIHRNTRPYKCLVCGKTFMYTVTLKNHMKTHTGEKNYECRVCNRLFTLSHQLKAHLQTIKHNEKVRLSNVA